MTRRLPYPEAPGPLEGYATRFDDLFGSFAHIAIRRHQALVNCAFMPAQPVDHAATLVDHMVQRAPPWQLQALTDSVAAGSGLHLYIRD